MDDEGDDIYGSELVQPDPHPTADAAIKEDPSSVEETKGEADEDEDDQDVDDDSDDSSMDIVVEAAEGAEAAKPSFAFQRARAEPVRISADPAATREKDSAQARRDSTAQVKRVAVKDGSKNPEVRTSKLDLDQDPIFDGTGKPITEIDLDADIAMETKPWRVAGTDPTDFFNYGFDEFTWVQYCLKQKHMRESVNGLKAESKQFEAMLGGPPAAGMPAMPSMPGMPDMPPEMMNAMFSQMQAQGVTDPSQMDFNSVMQNMPMMGMMPGMQGQQFVQGQQQQHGYGQYGGQGGSTPQPQQEDFSGYSDQQMSMYKQQQQQQGGFNNRRGRGRGRY